MTVNLWLVLWCLSVGFLVGRVWEARCALRAFLRRTDDAARFDVGSTITLTDGSTLRVVDSSPPPKRSR